MLPVIVGCGEKPEEPKYALKIGAVIDRTGNNSEPSWADSIALAEGHLNGALAASELSRIEFDVLLNDSQNSPAIAVERATSLVKTDGVKALILDTSQNSVAVNKLNYGTDPSTALNVPMQCSGCTSGSINNPAATHTDPVAQETLRNGKKWLFKGIMSTKLLSLVIARQLHSLGTAGDRNGDGKFKLAVYHSNEAFGNSTAKDVEAYAKMFRPDAIIEKRSHPSDAVADAYDWSADLAKLADDRSADGTTQDGTPDAIVVATFAQYYVGFVRAYKTGGFDQVVPQTMYVHTFRIQSAIEALGQFAEGSEGVSHVSVERSASGTAFTEAYQQQLASNPRFRDAQYYDNAMTLMLATLKAARGLEDPTQVDPAAVRDAMMTLSDPTAEIVRPGPEGAARAVQLIIEDKPMNYEGASGPMDHDANLTIKNRLAHYKVQDGNYVDSTYFDCIRSDECMAQ